MRHKSNRRKTSEAKLEMSAMIDVVFLLLIFFVLTVKVEDTLASLNVSAPAPSRKTG